MNTKKVYRYDEKGYFMYDDVAYESPLEPNVFPLPAYCTEVEPIKAKEGYKIRYNGEEWEYEEIPKEPEPKEPTLDELKTQKLVELKATRDSLEVAPLNNFDVDEKSLSRIDIANKILTSGIVPVLEWTMADNTVQAITNADFANLYIALATRSNELHEKYRALKEQVNACTSKEEIDAISFK